MGTLGESAAKINPVKRTIAKLRSKTHDDSSDEHEDGWAHNTHNKTEDYTASVAHALVREIFGFLNSDGGQSAVRNVVTTQAKTAANLAIGEGAKQASRVAAQEAVKGAYDAAESKYMEMWVKLPAIVKTTAVPVLACYLAALSIALLASLWRFALYGMN